MVVTTQSPRNLSQKYGRLLAHPPNGEEIVISGASGRFPESNNYHEFRDNLMNKTDMVTDFETRWRHFHPMVPNRTGKIKDIEKFDSGFFGIHYSEADAADPNVRKLLEVAIEAIMDAGVNPSELKGSRTGVFTGACLSETERKNFFIECGKDTNQFTGTARSMLANRVSYYLKLNGPSYNCDTACSSSSFALEHAYAALRNGECDQAIVGGTNVVIHPYASLQFYGLGVLSLDGRCKTFDESGNGYARSEAISALFLQKAKDSKRIYATIVHAKTNCDGFKETGITFPSSEAQETLMKEFYEECNIDPSSVTYMEAHGTGTKVGDPEECRAIDRVLVNGKRNFPLLVGSVKSNIGHSEATSGLCSIAKAIISFETGVIPGNMHFNKPKKDILPIIENRLKVVTEKTVLPNKNGLIGINSFGFGGGNCHILLKWNEKNKIKQPYVIDEIPKIVCVSGRNIDAVNSIFDGVKTNNIDFEHIRLIQDAFKYNINGHKYRGYAIFSSREEICRSIFSISENHNALKIHLVFGDIYEDNLNNFKDVFLFDALKDFVKDVNNILIEKEIKNLNKLIDYIFVEIFKQINIGIDLVIGYSLGTIATAYYKKAINIQQAIGMVYKISKNIDKVNENKISNNKIANYEHNANKLNKYIESDNIVINVGYIPTLKNGNKISLFEDAKINGVNQLLNAIGRLYELGKQPLVSQLYPKVQFPVSRSTPMISPYIKWNHKRDHQVFNFQTQSKGTSEAFKCTHKINIGEDDWKFITGHVIDGRNLFPATGYLCLVWSTFAQLHNCFFTEIDVVFENIKFIRACNVPKNEDSTLILTVRIQETDGSFEVLDGDMAVVTGKILKGTDSKIMEWSWNILREFKDNDVCLESKDIYKELRLRGYNYKGLFKALHKCSNDGNVAYVNWIQNNWIAFMDNLLQMKILQEDSRLLYVPTSINRLTIKVKEHIKYVESSDDRIVQAMCFGNIISCGGIEIRGLLANSIQKKKNVRIPILEKYEFVPNITDLPLKQSLRVNLQIILENKFYPKLKIIGIDDSNLDINDILTKLQEVIADQPIVQVQVNVIDDYKNLEKEQDCNIILGANLLNNKENKQACFSSITENGYIISLENLDVNNIKESNYFNILTIHTTEKERIFLISKNKSNIIVDTVINTTLNNENFEWLSLLQKSVKQYKNNIILYSQNEPENGILGLANCIRKEPKCDNISAYFISDIAPEFSTSDEFYRKQINKNMSVNVYKNNSWGTYRHLLLDEINEIPSKNCYINNTTKGDLSSLKWIQGKTLSKANNMNPESEFVEIYYSSLNFRDVMIASGKLNADLIVKNRKEQEFGIIGFEFSGKTPNGNRVMGMNSCGALSTMVKTDKTFLWDVPDDWSLVDAATVPVVYSTSLYALFIVGKIKSGDSVLIHSGTGGIGQAAINICLHMKCKVFTTVGTVEKRDFIKKLFPQLTDSQIGNSRDTSFEQLVLKGTKGRGVDLVLNSLSGEKLTASVRCLAKYGRFLEIGKYDLSQNNQLKLLPMKHGASFHGVMLDTFFNADPPLKNKLKELFSKALSTSMIKPLNKNIFRPDEVENAFRFMTTGNHTGKVLIQIRTEEDFKNNNSSIVFNVLPKYYCNENASYIICGGLGGFGLELADWLVLRGAKNLVLTSRKGIRTGYQAYRVKIWKKYGCNVIISTEDITTTFGCKNIIDQANSVGPIEGIFNLAVILEDAIIENQTNDKFLKSFGPKAYATSYFDKLSREFCPQLKDFVVFSSVSCGRGNAGQTNYGMANSVMERICEIRKKDGFPALAIQWGAIGDVGLVAEMQDEHTEIEIGGSLQQSISNCLQVLDKFLTQKEASIVSSVVVADKKTSDGSGSIVDSLATILGIKDLKTVSLHSTLAELGMDSMILVEVQQTLEREFDIFLAPEEIRAISLSKIMEMSNKTNEIPRESDASNKIDLAKLCQTLGDLDTAEIPVVKITKKIKRGAPKLFIIPGIDGALNNFDSVALKIKADVYKIQYCSHEQRDTVEDMVEVILKHLYKVVSKNEKFYLAGHSFGTVLALHICSIMEKNNYKIGSVICIDGSPNLMDIFTINFFKLEKDEAAFQTNLIKHMSSFVMPRYIMEECSEKLYNAKSLDERIELLQTHFSNDISMSTRNYVANVIKGIYKRVKSCIMYRPTFRLTTRVDLIKSSETQQLYQLENLGLSNICSNICKIIVLDGTHLSVLQNGELANEINNIIGVHKMNGTM